MRSYLYMACTSMLFGTIGVLIKMMGPDVPAMTITFYRVLLGFLFLLCVTPFIDKNTFKTSRKDLKDYLIVGAVTAISLSFFTLANLNAPVQNVVLLDNLTPFFVLGIAYVFLKEKITRTKLVSLAVAMAGLAIINPFQSGEYQLGNALAILAAATYAVLVVLMRKEDEKHGVGDAMWFFLFATLFMLPIPFIFGFGDLSAAWPLVLALGIVCTGLAYLFYNLALEKIEAEISTIMTMTLAPLVGITLAALALGEELNAMTIMGGLLLVSSVVYLQTHKLKRKEKAHGYHLARGAPGGHGLFMKRARMPETAPTRGKKRKRANITRPRAKVY